MQLNPYFSEQLNSIYAMNPTTGEIMDTRSGQVFPDATALGAYAQTLGGSEQQAASQASGGNPMGGALGTLGAIGGAEALTGGVSSAASGLGGASMATPAANAALPYGGNLSTALGAQGVGTSGATTGSGLGLGIGGTSTAGAAGAIGAGALTGYNQIKGLSEALQGERLSLGEQAALMLPTFGASFLYNPVSKMFGSGKGKDQRGRDAVRSHLRDGGFFDEPDGSGSDKLTLSDGTFLDWGKDGGARLQNEGANIDGKKERGYYDVDFSRTNAGDLTAILDPLGEIMGGGNSKLRSDFTGYGVNTVQQSKDPYAAARELYGKAGLDYGSARDNISKMGIDQGRKDAYYNSLDRLYQTNAYARK